MNAMTIVELKEARRRLGFSQEKLAVVLGVHRFSVLRWERGDHKIPSMLELALKQLAHEQRLRRREVSRIVPEFPPQTLPLAAVPQQLELLFLRGQLEFSTALARHVSILHGSKPASEEPQTELAEQLLPSSD
jgi:DNA-binding XRE family transcriptional regulator